MTEYILKKVMLVDDDTLLLDMYGMKFEKNNFEVECCQTADICISKLEEGYEPDIIMFDMVMPTMDGETLVKTIRDKKYALNAKMFVLSNQGQESDIEEVIKRLGIDGYIVKASHTPSQVVEKVKNILGVKN